jgi:hypothetical protein
MVVSFFLKRALRRMAKNMNKNFNQPQEDGNDNTSTNNNNNIQHKTSVNLTDKGEYVDFEEIKE